MTNLLEGLVKEAKEASVKDTIKYPFLVSEIRAVLNYLKDTRNEGEFKQAKKLIKAFDLNFNGLGYDDAHLLPLPEEPADTTPQDIDYKNDRVLWEWGLIDDKKS